MMDFIMGPRRETMRSLIKMLLLMVMVGVGHVAIAGDLEDGVAAAQKGDFSTALRLWTPLAERGNADAQYNLGDMYFEGQGVAQDYNTAVKWYTLAAEQGYASAQYNLGLMYSKGRGVAQDYKSAVKWYTLAAEQSYASAQ